MLLHQDAFAADYQEDEYMLLGMSTLLTACNLPQQRASSRSVSADRMSSVGLSNCLFVGKITISVNGMTLPRRAPATSHQNVAPAIR